jgi:DNA polymerase elongation subunit (family B)
MLTEDLFEKNGFSGYYLSRDITGNVEIIRDCGKSLYTFHGLKVGNRLTKKERDFILEKIKKILEKDISVLKKIVSLQNKEKELYEKLNSLSRETYTDNRFVYGKKGNSKIASSADGIDVIKYTGEEQFYIKINETEIEVLNNINTTIDQLKKNVIEYEKYHNELQNVRAELTELQSCKL